MMDAAVNSGGVEPVSWLERQAFARVLRVFSLEWIRVTLWDGSVLQPGEHGGAGLRILDRGTLRALLRNPSLGFGDGFSRGTLQVEGDLVAFLVRLFPSAHSDEHPLLNAIWRVLSGVRNNNTLTESRENIHSHYDIGNDFYQMWLDERMVYTCAYYPRAGTSLAEAQVAKLEHVCRKLALEPGQRVLELGCGWGALALHMAEHHGCEVVALNISTAQIEFARERARALGLAHRVEFVEEDYRNASGEFDRVVSVGMLEHVGVENYPALGEVIDRCLSLSGLGLIHSIGCTYPGQMDAWIEKRIFPGAHPPTLAEMEGIFAPFRLNVLDVENLRMHYARTCQDWLVRFEACFDDVVRKFDADFARAWRLYLAGSAAAFLASSLQLYQVLFAKARNNAVPRTREYVYGDQPTGADW